MFDTLVGIEADPKKEAEPTKIEAAPVEADQYGAPEKVQDVMPRRYQNSANQNLVNGVNVRRTTFYGQQNEPSLLQLQGEPERSGQTQQYDAYGPTEKVQNLMPRRYERSANSNYVDGVHVKRTTFYAQLEDDINPFTYNADQSASNAEILNSFSSVSKGEPKNIDTAAFTKDL